MFPVKMKIKIDQIGKRPGLVVMVGGSRSEGRGFDSRRRY